MFSNQNKFSKLFNHLLLLSVVALYCISCTAPYKVIPQISELPASKKIVQSAIDSVAIRMNFEVDKRNDSLTVLFKPPLHKWNSSRVFEVRKISKQDSTWVSVTGETFSPQGRIQDDANVYSYIISSAIEQEYYLQSEKPLFTQSLPQKKWSTFLSYNLISPGLGVYYGFSTPLSEKNYKTISLAFSGVDIVSLGFFLLPQGQDKTSESLRAMGLFGCILGRLVVPGIYFFSMQDYREFQKTPYYFDISLYKQRLQASLNWNL